MSQETILVTQKKNKNKPLRIRREDFREELHEIPEQATEEATEGSKSKSTKSPAKAPAKAPVVVPEGASDAELFQMLKDKGYTNLSGDEKKIYQELKAKLNL